MDNFHLITEADDTFTMPERAGSIATERPDGLHVLEIRTSHVSNVRRSNALDTHCSVFASTSSLRRAFFTDPMPDNGHLRMFVNAIDDTAFLSTVIFDE
jgi:hypothetical protein